MMAAHGLHQPKDFQFVMAGAHPQRWKALQAGTLDAAIQLVPFNYMAEEAGFPNLGDVDISYYQAGLFYNWGRGQVNPFFGVSLGVAHIEPKFSTLESQDRFAGSLAGGVKVSWTINISDN